MEAFSVVLVCHSDMGTARDIPSAHVRNVWASIGIRSRKPIQSVSLPKKTVGIPLRQAGEWLGYYARDCPKNAGWDGLREHGAGSASDEFRASMGYIWWYQEASNGHQESINGVGMGKWGIQALPGSITCA